MAVSGVSYDPGAATMYQCRGRDIRRHRRHSRSVPALYWDIRPLQVTTITNSRLLCHWKHHNFMPLSQQSRLNINCPTEVLKKLSMGSRWLDLSCVDGICWLVLYLIREVFPECECDNLIVDDTWDMTGGDLGLVTRPSSRWQTSQRGRISQLQNTSQIWDHRNVRQARPGWWHIVITLRSVTTLRALS